MIWVLIILGLTFYFFSKNKDEILIKTNDSLRVWEEKDKLKEIENETDIHSNELLVTDFGTMLKQELFSDVDIECGNTNFKAHKCILSARSPTFKNMFKLNMKEKNENLVIINNVDSEAVRAMLEYLYTGKVSGLLTTSTACELLALSDMYETTGLKKSCVSMLLSLLSDENALQILVNGHLYDEILKLYAVQYICVKFENIETHTEWESFQKENSILAMELMTAKINYMKLNLW